MSLIDESRENMPAATQVATTIPSKTKGRRRSGRPDWREYLPYIALALILIAVVILVPGARSYSGFELLLSASTAAILAAMAQMFIITAGDIDLSLGAYVGLINVLCATQLDKNPGLAIVAMIASFVAYVLMGIIIHVRRIPSIVVTLGASLVWLGTAILILPSPGGAAPNWLIGFFNLSPPLIPLPILILPSPGGAAPNWLIGFFNLNPPLIPLPILIALAAGAFGHIFMMRTAYGVILRGMGANAKAIRRAGWSLLRGYIVLYAMAAVFGILAGLAVTGLTTSGDANVSLDYTLLTIASVILGGGEFSGGKSAAFGTVVGAITMSLAGSLLVFLQLSPDYQLGVQGLILILVLAGRSVGRQKEA